MTPSSGSFLPRPSLFALEPTACGISDMVILECVAPSHRCEGQKYLLPGYMIYMCPSKQDGFLTSTSYSAHCGFILDDVMFWNV